MAARKEPPKTEGRDEAGRFTEGNPGRPPGARNKLTRAAFEALEEHAGELTAKVVELALDGDVAALRLAMERLIPSRKDAPIDVDLPPVRTAEDALAASAAILKAVADGDATPLEGAALASLLEGHRKLVEATDFENRLTALENRDAER